LLARPQPFQLEMAQSVAFGQFESGGFTETIGEGNAAWLTSMEEARGIGSFDSAVLAFRQEQLIEGFSAVSVSRAIWAMGKQGSGGSHVGIADLAETALSRIDEFTFPQLSMIQWGLAKRRSHEELCQKAMALAYASLTPGLHLMQWQPGNTWLVCSLWAVAKLRLRGEELQVFAKRCLDQISGNVDKSREDLSVEQLASVFWACAELQGSDAPALAEAAQSFMLWCVRAASWKEDLSSSPQELAMLLWALAKVFGSRTRSVCNSSGLAAIDRLVGKAAHAASQRISHFSPQVVADISWALATLNLGIAAATDVYIRMMQDVPSRVREFPPKAIANCCWALRQASRNKLMKVSFTFREVVAQDVQRRLGQFELQDLAGITSVLILGEPNMQVHNLCLLLVIYASAKERWIDRKVACSIATSGVAVGLQAEVMSLLEPKLKASHVPQGLQAEEALPQA